MKAGLWTAALLAAGTVHVSAQQHPTMTLDEAMSIARARNPAYQRARAQIDMARVGVRAGWGAFLPNLTADLSWSGNSQTQVTGQDDFGRTVTLPDAVTFQRSSASQSISGGVTLFDGLSNFNQLRAARHDVAAANATVTSQGVQVEADVATRFYGAIRAQRLLNVERDLLTSAQERYAANQRLFAVATISQVDLLGAEVDMARQEHQLERQQGDAYKARMEVLEALGVLDEVLDFQPVGEFPTVFDPAGLDADRLVARALDANPLIAQRLAEGASAQRRATAARGGRYPSVALSAGFSRGLNEQNYGAFFEVNPQDRNFRFTLNVQWQVFNRFQTSQQVAQADLTRRQAEESLREAELQVERQVRAAFVDLQTAYAALQTQRRSTELSRTRVDLAREQYRQGSITFTNLQQIINDAATAERSLVEAEYNFAVALVNLEAQIGERVVSGQ